MRRTFRMKWRHLGIALSLVLFAIAMVALHHILAEVHLADVLARVRVTPVEALLLSLACTAGSYLALTGYDVLALRHLGKPLPYGKAALASFTSYTFSHNIGLSLVTGGSIRYRIYSAVGLSATEIATLTGFCALTFGLGIGLILGLALLLEPSVIGTADGLSPALNRAAGFLILLLVAGYVLWTAVRRRPIAIRNWSLETPSVRTTLAQLAVGALDIGLAAAALYAVLPPEVPVSLAAFVGIYVAAMTVGVLSHSPGGLGVFEAVMLLALPGTDQGALLGALLVYRCIYYLLPLAAAAALLAWHEYRLRRRALAPAVSKLRSIALATAPEVIGVAVFAGGVMLLFSGATPALEERTAVLRHVLPLPFVEASHLFGSLVGLWLLILSRGLFRRLDGAYRLTLGLLGAGMLFSLLKGFDYEEALILGFVAILLLASRPAFYRKASLLNQPFSGAWIATIVLFVGASIWLGVFAYKHVEYSGALWWDFAYRGDAPRFLRASIAVAALAFGLLAFILLRPAPPRELGATADPETLRAIVSRSPHSDSNLALTGDKRFLVSQDADAFIMFRVQGRSWVAMGDPVGPESAWEPLLWHFRELCDRHSGWPVFYQVPSDSLPHYLDLGLSLLKLGEEARVDLRAFSLEGSARRELRYVDRRATKEGAAFEVVPAGEVPNILTELNAVSDAWLADKATHEKGFSVGAFSEAYLTNFDCAVVRHDQRIVAFANIWRAPAGKELSVDLMRHLGDAPYGIMDFLFLRLMLWGKDRGDEWFNLGMAPLSGLESRALGPVWNRIGAFVFRHGEHFYNFEGLRAYKEKFGPVWQPKYLAAPGGLALPRILFDIAALISGGAEEIFRR